MCAEQVWYEESQVIPGHSFINRDNLHFMSRDSLMPNWCEHTLEQTIVSPDEKVEVTPDAKLAYDGNGSAVFSLHQKLDLREDSALKDRIKREMEEAIKARRR
jgi:hypothetical protein